MRDCWLTSLITDLGLKLVEDMGGSANERSDNFQTGWTNCKDRWKQTEEQKKEILDAQTHGGRDRKIDEDRRRISLEKITELMEKARGGVSPRGKIAEAKFDIEGGQRALLEGS